MLQEAVDGAEFPQLSCDLCGTQFSTPAAWVRHLQNDHSAEQLAASNKHSTAPSSATVTAKPPPDAVVTPKIILPTTSSGRSEDSKERREQDKEAADKDRQRDREKMRERDRNRTSALAAAASRISFAGKCKILITIWNACRYIYLFPVNTVKVKSPFWGMRYLFWV